MALRTLVVAVLALTCVARSAPDDSDDLKKIVEEQGKELERLRKEMGELKAKPQRTDIEREVENYLDQTESPVRGVAGGWSRDPGLSSSRLRLGGYFSIEYRDDGDGKTPSFDFHRLVIKLQADIANGISFDSEIEFEGGGADVSFLTGNEILIEYAELRFEIYKSYVAFDAGVILIPWGRFNFYHDDPMNDLTDRPLVSRRIGAVAFGMPGIAVDGVVPFAQSWFLDYKVALVQGFGEEFTTKDGARSARQSFREDNNHNKQLFGRFVVSAPVNWLDTLEYGGSANWGKWDDNDDFGNYGWAVELFIKRGPWELTAEYMWQRIEQPTSADVSKPRRQSGWYAQLAYHFYPESWRGKHVLSTQESTFTLVVRVEEIDLNHDTTGTEFRDDLFQVTLGFNWRPVERTVFKVSYTWRDTELFGFEGGSADQFIVSWATYF